MSRSDPCAPAAALAAAGDNAIRLQALDRREKFFSLLAAAAGVVGLASFLWMMVSADGRWVWPFLLFGFVSTASGIASAFYWRASCRMLAS